MNKIAVGVAILAIGILIASGIVSAYDCYGIYSGCQPSYYPGGVYNSHYNYYNDYRNTYYGSMFPNFYNGYDSNQYYAPAASNYNAYYGFNMKYNNVISYTPPNYKATGYNEYNQEYQYSSGYFPVG